MKNKKSPFDVNIAGNKYVAIYIQLYVKIINIINQNLIAYIKVFHNYLKHCSFNSFIATWHIISPVGAIDAGGTS